MFDSVLACAKSAHVFQKLTRFADFVSNNSSSDSLCFIAFSSSPTAVPCLLLAVQYYTVGIPSEPLVNDSHKCLCSTEKLQYRMLKSLDHTLPLHTCHVHVTCYGDVHGNIPHKENG